MQTTAHGLRVNREGLGDPRPVAPLEQPLAERLDEHRTMVLGSRSSSPKYPRRRARTATGSATQTSSSRESSTKVGQFVRSDRQPEDGLGVEVLGSEQDRSVDLRLGQARSHADGVVECLGLDPTAGRLQPDPLEDPTARPQPLHVIGRDTDEELAGGLDDVGRGDENRVCGWFR